ncbi:MAG: extracellular solute-binding protein [Treponema sp.]|nr:extracellular solute-binding protein [Treponema sp.]
MYYRKIVPFIINVFIILCLTSCHGKKSLPAFSMPDQFDTSRHIELSFWAKNDTNKIQTEAYEKAIRDFEKLYPNVKVNMKIYTDYNRIYNDVITNISTFTTPNVCITYPDHIATYNTGVNIVVPLDELLENEKYGLGGSALHFDSVRKEEIVPQFLQEGFLEGHQFALPFMRSTEALYINKNMVEKLGYEIPETVTWNWLWKLSEEANAKDENGIYSINNQNVMIPFIYKSTDNMLIQYLAQKNAGYSEESGRIYIFNEETESFLNEVAVHAGSRAFSTFAISSYPGNFLNAGQCIFAVDSTAGATWMGGDAPLSDISEDKLVQFETVVKPVPQADPENPKMISQGPSLCIFNKADSQEVLASWLFAQFLLTNETQITYAQTEGYVPVTLRAQKSDEFQDYLARAGEDNSMYYKVKIDAARLILENPENSFTTPVFNGSASLRNAASQLVENVCKAARRNQKIDSAFMQKNFDDVTALFRLNEIKIKEGNAASGESKKDLGPLPQIARNLLAILFLVWCVIITYFIRRKK